MFQTIYFDVFLPLNIAFKFYYTMKVHVPYDSLILVYQQMLFNYLRQHVLSVVQYNHTDCLGLSHSIYCLNRHKSGV